MYICAKENVTKVHKKQMTVTFTHVFASHVIHFMLSVSPFRLLKLLLFSNSIDETGKF